MRTVYLCRHAKSSWGDAQLSDHDRPLNERGQRNAPFMAHLFAKRGEPVDLLISSTALRARTTAFHFAKALGREEADVQLVPELFHPSVQTIQQVISGLPNTVSRVMLFGHNPGFSLAVAHLSDTDVGVLPTCGIVRIDLPIDDWAIISKGLGTLVWQDHPKRHPGQD
jgi:phosphohistidine phosphatase